MTFVGLTVRISGAKPHLRAVLLDDSAGLSVDRFDYLAPSGVEPADMIHAVVDGLAGRLAQMDTVRRVVVRQADTGGRGGGTAPAVLRARTEGAALYVARQYCPDVRIVSGPEVGRACGANLAEVERRAASMVPADWTAAGAAALAALNL